MPGGAFRATIYRMPDISTLFGAALVSAVVALGVEWLARPGLEARKERILARSRARDQVWRALNDILFAAATMRNEQVPEADAEAAAARIIPAAQNLEDSYREVILFDGPRAIDLTSHYVAMARGVMASDRALRQKGAELFDGTALITNVLARPGQVPRYWLYRLRRRRRAREAGAFLGIGEEGDEGPRSGGPGVNARLQWCRPLRRLGYKRRPGTRRAGG